MQEPTLDPPTAGANECEMVTTQDRIELVFNMGGDRYYTFAKKNVRFVVLDTNLMGAWYCIKHAAPVMRGQGRGVIINVTSVAAFSGLGRPDFLLLLLSHLALHRATDPVAKSHELLLPAF